jgi:hypothetical protein
MFISMSETPDNRAVFLFLYFFIPCIRLEGMSCFSRTVHDKIKYTAQGWI